LREKAFHYGNFFCNTREKKLLGEAALLAGKRIRWKIEVGTSPQKKLADSEENKLKRE